MEPRPRTTIEQEDGPTTSGKLMETGMRQRDTVVAYIPGKLLLAMPARELGEDSF